MAAHTSDIVTNGCVESSIRQGVAMGFAVAANFATNEATTLANIAGNAASVRALNGQSHDNYILCQEFINAVKLGFRLDTAAKSSVMIGGNLQNIYDNADSATWQAGFSAGL